MSHQTRQRKIAFPIRSPQPTIGSARSNSQSLPVAPHPEVDCRPPALWEQYLTFERNQSGYGGSTEPWAKLLGTGRRRTGLAGEIPARPPPHPAGNQPGEEIRAVFASVSPGNSLAVRLQERHVCSSSIFVPSGDERRMRYQGNFASHTAQQPIAKRNLKLAMAVARFCPLALTASNSLRYNRNLRKGDGKDLYRRRLSDGATFFVQP